MIYWAAFSVAFAGDFLVAAAGLVVLGALALVALALAAFGFAAALALAGALAFFVVVFFSVAACGYRMETKVRVSDRER